MKATVIRKGIAGLLLGALTAAIILIIPDRNAAGAGRSPVPAAEMSPSVRFTAPVGGEDLRAGSAYRIRWEQRQCGGTFRLELWDGERAEWSTIATEVPATGGEYRWQVPESLAGHRFRVRAVLDGSPKTSWLSGDYFTIETPDVSADRQSTSGTETPEAVSGRAAPTLHCFPSISDDRIRCEWNGFGTPTTLSVWSATGALVASYAPGGGATAFPLMVGSWSSGMYTVTATFADGRQATGRFVVRR